MASVTIWAFYCITRVGDSTYLPGAANAAHIVRNISDELLECITDPAPNNSTNTAGQYGWIGGTDPGTGISKLEVCDACETHTNLRDATFSDGLKVAWYFDKVTKKCVAPGTGVTPTAISQNPVYSYQGGAVIPNPVVWLIFWGTTWGSQTTLKNSIIDLVQNKLLGTDKGWWDTAKADYGTFATPLWGGSVTLNQNTPATPSNYNSNHIVAALDAMVLAAPGNGLPTAATSTFISQGVTCSNNIYVLVPDPTWVAANPDPGAGVGYGWEAYHWTRSYIYNFTDPPPPPGTPPSSTPPPPPGHIDASGLGANTIDGLKSTAWTATGTPYITFNLGFPLEISTLKIDFLDGDKKMYFFDIDWSVDNTTWNNIAPTGSATTWRSTGKSTGFESIVFSSIIAQYIRLTGHGNNNGTGTTATNNTFAIAEAQIWGPDVPTAFPPSGGTAPPPPGTGAGQWVWTGTDWVWIPSGGESCCTTTTNILTPNVNTPPTSTTGPASGTTGGTGTDTGTTGPVISAAPPPIVTIFRDFTDSYNLGIETGDLCASDNFPGDVPLVEVFNSPVASTANYMSMAMAGAQCQRVGEAIMTDASQLIGVAPRKVTITMKRVGTADGLVYCRIRNSKGEIVQEIDTYPAASVGLNDTQIDFQNNGAQHILAKGDIIWIEYADPSAQDGNTYLMYKIADKDNYDAINSIFVKYTNTTVPDPLTDLAAKISV